MLFTIYKLCMYLANNASLSLKRYVLLYNWQNYLLLFYTI